uniref:Ion transport domain-containing protein n=1 Tax=Ditylum brightwellii TaxID=49249 RepID=A0A6U3T150_9STRA|mmetsp:Transcript_36134/g.53894  ORF Transcript_36134/g.53894 Transcript_36134/m.53894 type:complete len:379 (+) Transcript_36134:103-1239(+)
MSSSDTAAMYDGEGSGSVAAKDTISIPQARGSERQSTPSSNANKNNLVGDYDDNSDDSNENGRKERFWEYFAHFRHFCGDLVNHPFIDKGIILFIIINSVMMGIATFDFVTENPDIEHDFETVDKVFLIIFTIESALQFIFHGFNLFTKGELVFDLVIIVLSWFAEDLQIIRAFRVFRVLRLVTRIDTLRKLVSALFSVLPRLSAITALLLLVFYIFAVLFTALFKDLPLDERYFNRLDLSLYTLFVMMTMEWAGVARQCMEYHKWAWAPFVAFIALSGFIVFNLIIAVICDAVAVIEREDEEEVSIADQQDERVDELSKKIEGLLKNQRELQATLDLLSKELYNLQVTPSENPTSANITNNSDPSPLKITSTQVGTY